MFKRLKKILIGGEEELFKKLLRIVGYSLTSINLLIEMSKEEIKGGIDKLILFNEEISSLEKKADNENIEIINYVMKGSILPGLRGQFIYLANTLDDILDTIHVVSREILRVKKLSNLTPTKDILFIHNKTVFQLEHSRRMVELLQELFNSLDENWETIIALSASIERLEEGGDALKEESLDILYNAREKMDWFTFGYYRNRIYLIDDIQDGCEDAANTFVMIISQILS
jgi:predicted phosphate transport protein (TIGR00153 family)